MFLRYFFIITFFFCFNNCLFAKNDSIVENNITAGDYRIFLTNSDSHFFTGSIQMADKYNNTVFSADSIFTRYNWDTLIDLDGDGNKEFILDVGTGATMYDYNMYLIFDFTKKKMDPLEVHNAELDTKLDDIPKILSYVRMSPAVMGAGYTFSLRYDDGNLVLENNTSDSKVLKTLVPDEKDDLYFIDEYENGFDECENDSEIKIYYEANLMQWKIVGQEDRGWKFFDKHYKCKDKKKVKAGLRKIINENYSYISKTENYKFNLNNY